MTVAYHATFVSLYVDFLLILHGLSESSEAVLVQELGCCIDTLRVGRMAGRRYSEGIWQ